MQKARGHAHQIGLIPHENEIKNKKGLPPWNVLHQRPPYVSFFSKNIPNPDAWNFIPCAWVSFYLFEFFLFFLFFLSLFLAISQDKSNHGSVNESTRKLLIAALILFHHLFDLLFFYSNKTNTLWKVLNVFGQL